MPDAFPLTPLQHAMYCAWLRAPRAGQNVEQWIIRFNEPVDATALQRAWNQTVAGCGALRTVIESNFVDGDLPRQRILSQVPERFERHDWRGLSGAEQASRWRTLLAADRERGLDLHRPPLWRGQLVQFAANEFRWLCTYHHVLLDGRSLTLLGRELAARYDAERRGVSLPSKAEPSFRAFVESLQGSDAAAAADFWRAQLAERADGPKLPEPQRPVRDDVELTAEATAELDAARYAALRAAAAAAGVTVHSFVQAAWGLTLAAFTGNDDHVFGSVRACRKRPVDGVERMIGMLINTVPFRARIDRAATVRTWLKELRRRQFELRDYETTPPADVARFVGLGSDEPLFPTLLMFTDVRPEAMLDAAGAAHPTRSVELRERSDFPLSLTVAADDRLTICLEYSVERYAAEVAGRVLEYFRYLLATLPERLDDRLGDLPSVTPVEAERLHAWARAAENPPVERTISERFAARVAESPDAPALLCGERTVSYFELHEQAGRYAEALAARGVGRGDFVGVFCDRTPELPALVLGLWQCGAVYVPLDPKYPSQRLTAIVDVCRPKLVVCDRPFVAADAAGGPTMVEVHELAAASTGAAADAVPNGPRLDDRAVVLFTSGSTGTPKGVVLTHANLANHNQHVVRRLQLAAGDRMAPVSSINFDASLEEFFCPLAAGATVVLPEPDVLGSLARLLEFIERRQLTILDLPTSLWRELTNYLYESRRQYPASVRLIFMGGEAATRTVYERFLQVGGRRLRWINAYGPTETTIFSTAYEHDPTRDAGGEAAPPIGRPIDNTLAYVLDARGRLAPAGVGGELYLGGAGVAEGYLARPDLTAEKFVDRPSGDLPPGRYYRTGDQVRLRDDGVLEYVGRIDDQIKLRGFRIEPAEIEAVLLRHPAVRDAAVVTQTSAAGTKYLAAYLVLHEGAAWDERAWREFACARLPEYMVPRAFVQLETLPLTPNGKVDRRALPEPVGPEPRAARDAAAGADPTVWERRVLDIWRDTLRLDELDLHEDFFVAGGDSLRAMTLAAKLESALGRPIAPTLLWRARTAAAMAAELAESPPAVDDEPLILMRDGDHERPLFFVHSLAGDVWIYGDLVRALNSTVAVYGIPLVEADAADGTVDRLELCAAAYIHRIRALQPHGPYRLAGYSSGGLIAYEMTRQLSAAGEQVEFLGLLDSGVPTACERRLTASRFDRMCGLLRSVPGYFGELRAMPLTARWKRIGRFAAGLLRRFRPVVSPQAESACELNDREILECFAEDISFFPAERLAMIRRHYQALEAYDPPAVETPAHLLRSSRQPMFAVQTPTMGWEQLIRGPLSVVQLGGSHSTLMRPPHVDRAAAAVDAALHELDAQRAATECEAEPNAPSHSTPPRG